MGSRNMNTRRPSASQYHSPPENHSPALLQGPRRVACFCLLAVILPCTLVSVALLMRFVVHGSYIYHLSPSDMRILDQRISTIWCQSEKVKGNTSFTAYMTNGEPELIESSQPQIIERNLIIPDDHKEYWGFYLLKGSTFRIHTCARWRGGTLLIVRGRSHLEHCAYIGEADSAGDSDQFSDSESEEKVADRGLHPLYNSKEEISVILSKIRQYIRSRPKNYAKLKKNLADWMLLESEKSEERLSILSAVQSNWSSESLQPTSQGGVPTKEELKMEDGSIQRTRRQVHLSKRSESGENGAFEEADDDPVQKPSHDLTRSTERSIWADSNGHHSGILNNTVDSNDGSDSESESSWSSSEEAMAKCEGVLAFFNIQPNASCGLETEEAIMPYYEGHVNVSGYYYFIFGSENEKRDNVVRARFDLHKFLYSLPQPIENCTQVRECQVHFQFGSAQKLVITVPEPPPNLEFVWDEIYIAETECEPRTGLYLIFVLTVPLIILLCAFQ